MKWQSFREGFASAFQLFPDPVDYASMVKIKIDLDAPLMAGFDEDAKNIRGDFERAMGIVTKKAPCSGH